MKCQIKEKVIKMTFKECRKFGREEMNRTGRRYGYISRDKSGEYQFSFERTGNDLFVLEKNGVVDKIINGNWLWDYQKRGLCPKNEKGWKNRIKAEYKRKLKLHLAGQF